MIKKAEIKVEYNSLKLITFNADSSKPLVFSYKQEEINKRLFADFIKGVQKGQVLMDVESEPLASFEQQPYLVKDVNFDHLHEIFDHRKDSFLVFYRNQDLKMIEEYNKKLESLAGTLERNGDSHIFFGKLNVDRNSHFGLAIIERKLPVVRFYKRYDVKEFTEVSLSSVRTVQQIMNLIADLSSEQIHFVQEYEQDI